MVQCFFNMALRVKFIGLGPSEEESDDESSQPNFRRSNLERTKSRSVECMKNLEGRDSLRKGLMRSLKGREEDTGSERSVDSFTGRQLSRSTRSQSYYGTKHRSSLVAKDGSAGNISPLRRSARNSSPLTGVGRCGSMPPGSYRSSLASVQSGDPMANLYNSRLQSEESLIIDNSRQQEKQWMNQTRIREEMSIINHIKKRELIDMKKKEYKIPPIVEREEPQIRSGAPKSILQGLLSSRTLLMAPGVASLIHPTSAVPNPKPTPPSDKDRLEKWVPRALNKSKVRPLIRRLIEAKLVKDDLQQTGTDFLGSEFNRECCEWHNYYRTLHTVQPLTLDQKLCASAQYWANILAHRDEYFHQNPPDLGENLFAWPIPIVPETNVLESGPDITGKDVVVFWYKKLKDYYFFKPHSVLHVYAAQFSQMIWASSTTFGCGKARTKSGKLIVVAHYHPKGNIPGQFHLNVFPPIEDSDQSEAGSISLTMDGYYS